MNINRIELSKKSKKIEKRIELKVMLLMVRDNSHDYIINIMMAV